MSIYVEPCRDPEAVDGVCVKQPECRHRCERQPAQYAEQAGESKSLLGPWTQS